LNALSSLADRLIWGEVWKSRIDKRESEKINERKGR
jgi:hypothetical protein